MTAVLPEPPLRPTQYFLDRLGFLLIFIKTILSWFSDFPQNTLKVSRLLKRIVKTIVSLVLLLAFTAPALAEGFFEGQPYFGFSAMLAGAKNSKVDDATGSPDPVFTTGAEVITQVGYGLSFSGGWLLDSNWRTELEFSRRNVQLDSITGSAGTASLEGELTINAGFINVARDFRGKSFVTPYVGLGVGVAFHELDLEAINSVANLSNRTATTLAFQALLGVELEVSEDTDIVVGYRYVNYYAPDYSQFSYDFVDFHNFELGIRFYVEDW